MGASFSSDVEYNSTTIDTTSNLHTILNATIGQGMIGPETYTEKWIEDAIAADVISMDELNTYPGYWSYRQNKAWGILRSMSGMTSVIFSLIFIWMILRSHDCLSTTQHRLLLGLCIFDILSSLSWSTFNATVPSDYDYIVWNAKGNQATSTAQGFILTFGMYGGLYYNVSLNIYFLAVVKYKKGNEFIRKKIEPFLHGLPIAVALSYSIYLLLKQQYNGDFLYSSTNDVPHCYGYKVGQIREGFEIPCWRGVDGYSTAIISRVVLMFIPAVIMVVLLGMIYCAIRTQTKKLAKYGVGALRSNLQQQSVSTPHHRTVQDKQSSIIWIRITMLLVLTVFIIGMMNRILAVMTMTFILAVMMIVALIRWIYYTVKTQVKERVGDDVGALRSNLQQHPVSTPQQHTVQTNKPVTSRSNNVQSQSRAVMHKAFGYTLAWFLSYGTYLIGNMMWYFPRVLEHIMYICMPLQGFFNLLIFMHPKIVAAKKSKPRGEDVSWCEAFSTAFWSKGKGSRNRGTSRSKLRGHSNRPLRKNRNQNAASGDVKIPMFGGIKKKTKKKRNKAYEEEKCEIQVPDNLNPNMTRAMYSAACPAIYERNIVPSPSAATSTAPTVNLSTSTDDMVGVKKVDFDKNVNGGNALLDIVESSMESEDEEEGMSEAEMENMEIVPMAAAADEKEQKETSMENEDEEKEISADEENVMSEAEMEDKDVVPMAAADMNKQKDIAIENENGKKKISANEEEEINKTEMGNKDVLSIAAADVKEISTEGE